MRACITVLKMFNLFMLPLKPSVTVDSWKGNEVTWSDSTLAPRRLDSNYRTGKGGSTPFSTHVP